MFHPIKTTAFHSDNPLHWFSIHADKNGAQRLMPFHNPVQRLSQRCTIQVAMQAHGERNVIHLTGALQLRQKPQPLLGIGQRKRVELAAPLFEFERQ
jgi:hypothetical protein